MRSPANPGKLSRVDLRKYLDGGVAGRREAVATIGDALREEGGVRLEGDSGEADDEAAALAAVADQLLAALGEYFGLPPRAFAAGATARPLSAADAGTLVAALGDALLAVLPVAPAGAEVRGVAGWTPVPARPRELLALPGGVLTRLTAGVVPPSALRWREGAAARVVVVAPPPGAALEPRAEFATRLRSS